MGKARKAKRKPQVDASIRPTPEREAKNETISAGMARRIKPMIDTLYERGDLSVKQWEALHYYRDQASLADRSPVRSCCDPSVRGVNDNGPGVAIMSAKIETARMERDMVQLWRIARAIAVDDLSLSQWCINEHGGRERYDGRGRFVAMVPVNEKFNMAQARLQLRYAAGYIVK